MEDYLILGLMEDYLILGHNDQESSNHPTKGDEKGADIH
jgi:hypothetical protein